jgi:hypothetical protein
MATTGSIQRKAKVKAPATAATASSGGIRVTRPSGGDFFTPGAGPFTFEIADSGTLVIKNGQGEAVYAFASGQWFTANAR